MIPFNRPYTTGKEIRYIKEAISDAKLSGDGPFTRKCNSWLEGAIGCQKALLTHSCTGALEMAALLVDIKPGDEVIMPSYTFVSTANAFVLRGGVPVFVDIRSDTLNIDEQKIEDAITEKTKAIVPVHYAGVPCEMDRIMEIAEKYNLLVIEDAAQGIMSSYKGRLLGSIGHMAAISFHETKNIISGEGGALLINDPHFIGRAEIVREKGTDRSKFLRGYVDKYTWVDVGSSYLPGELIAAFLLGQLESAESTTQKRAEIWMRYHEAFADLENRGKIRRPSVPFHCKHNAHMYYILLSSGEQRGGFLDYMNEKGIGAVFHYIPLHSSRAGIKYGRAHGRLKLTDELSERLVRIPLYPSLSTDEADFIIQQVNYYLSYVE